jgi:hypothetical protein
MKIHRLPGFILRRLSSIYLRFAEGISEVRIEGLQTYLDELEGFKNGSWRLIIAFRHISKADAPVLATLFGRIIPRQQRSSPGNREHFWVRFLFGDMVLDWAPAAARWLFPRIGSLPVSNQMLVRSQVDAIRRVLGEGVHPLCLAPEGQVNYYNERSGAVTHGVSHFTRWALSDGPAVKILPVRIYYEYRNPSRLVGRAVEDLRVWLLESESFADGEADTAVSDLDGAVSMLLRRLARYLGLEIPDGRDSSQAGALDTIRTFLLEQARDYCGGEPDRRPIEQLFLYRNEVFRQLRESGMDVPTISAAIGKGWKQPEQMSPLLLHYQRQQILDALTNFDPGYHRHGSPPFPVHSPEGSSPGTGDNRRAEQALYVMDIINRVRGGDINSRYFPGGTRARVEFYPALEIRRRQDADGWIEYWQQRFNGE